MCQCRAFPFPSLVALRVGRQGPSKSGAPRASSLRENGALHDVRAQRLLVEVPPRCGRDRYGR